MHHKRKRPKNARAGCLHCKPWKANRAKNTKRVATLRADVDDREQRAEAR